MCNYLFKILGRCANCGGVFPLIQRQLYTVIICGTLNTARLQTTPHTSELIGLGQSSAIHRGGLQSFPCNSDVQPGWEPLLQVVLLFPWYGILRGQRWDIAARIEVDECLALGRFLLVLVMRTTLKPTSGLLCHLPCCHQKPLKSGFRILQRIHY